MATSVPGPASPGPVDAPTPPPAPPSPDDPPTGTEGAAATGWFGTYRRGIHGVFALVMLVLTVALAVVGLHLEPSNGPPPPSHELSLLSITITPHPDPFDVLSPLAITEALQLTGGSSGELDLNVDANAPAAASYTWKVDAVYFHGQLCPQQRSGVHTSTGNLIANPKLQTPRNAYTEFSGQTSAGDQQAIGDIIQLDLCWTQGSPATLRDGYLTSTLPPLEYLPPFNPNATSVTVPTWDLTQNLGGGRNTVDTLAEYQQQAGQPPTDISPSQWSWVSTLTDTSSNEPRLVNAVSLPQLQKENHDAFLAGVLFGIAGGALVAFLQEVLVPLRRRP
ncbi:MAG TPA: hypothetical protein VKG43_08905 [Acidimicrobiales bacterium]|nr:hypothetical protein [Acidimicrobiales bacterium]